MQLNTLFFYALVAINVTVSYAGKKIHPRDLSNKQVEEPKLTKRDASVLVDYTPTHNVDINKRNVIFKTRTKQRYAFPGSKFNDYAKYVKPNKFRVPNKKYELKKVNTKFYVSRKMKPSPKPELIKHTSSKSQTFKPDLKARKKRPHRVPKAQKQTHKIRQIMTKTQIPYPDKKLVGFGEPPNRLESNYENNPLVYTFDAPMKSVYYETHHNSANNVYDHFDNSDSDFKSWPDVHASNSVQYSHKYKPQSSKVKDYYPEYIMPHHNPVFEYADIFKSTKTKPTPHNSMFRKRPDLLGHLHKLINKPWKASSEENDNSLNPLLVGGQYAEPPARLTSMRTKDDNAYTVKESFDAEPLSLESSFSVSPYVNYKNSNMAFSPQNLNDAFSIVD